ncbi:DoxX family protein [Hylemonella gracilis]|uniref:DoxX family protein n=1 Tax=Hylemonella gracilis TaxID=80880 RepID=A0A4P6UN57_9BURK|nr:DoxX family protein [Hylemonella gracilis]QBK05507.1 DoxX family protein [Hylemonella gracilis]
MPTPQDSSPSGAPLKTAASARQTSLTAALRARWNRGAEQLERWIGHDLLAVLGRVAMAALFFQSGRTKVTGLLTVSEGTYTLFREEYRLPLLPPELAAHLAAYAEHLFPLLLLLGLATRLSALALLGMTLVIQVFVYPDAWPTHVSWAGLLLYLAARGGGALSVDRALGLR